MTTKIQESTTGTHDSGFESPLRASHPLCDADTGLALYKFIIHHLPIAVVAIDSDFRIIEFNPWAERLTGLSALEAMKLHCWEALQSELCETQCPLKTVLDQVETTISSRTNIRNRDGETIPVQFIIAALFDAEGRRIGGVEALMDISQLVSMERERANFISMLAHDMRSSLTGIHGLGLRLLRKPQDMDEDKERKHLELITREAAKLESLIDDFIELARIETGRLKLNFAATSLDKELEEIFEIHRFKAMQQGIELKLQIEEILPVIEADCARLRRIFNNLLDNAVKFSKEHGTIVLAAREQGSEVMISVTDEGAGIDPEDLPHIFDAFHRGKTAEGKAGHGLGLATVKAIVEGHGGRVLVSSQLNKGTCFTVYLPKRNAGAKSAPLPALIPDVPNY